MNPENLCRTDPEERQDLINQIDPEIIVIENPRNIGTSNTKSVEKINPETIVTKYLEDLDKTHQEILIEKSQDVRNLEIMVLDNQEYSSITDPEIVAKINPGNMLAENKEKMCRSDQKILTEKSESNRVKISENVIREKPKYFGPTTSTSEIVPKINLENKIEENPEFLCKSNPELLTGKSEGVKNSEIMILKSSEYMCTNPKIMAKNDLPKNMVEGNLENLGAKNAENLEIPPTSRPKKCRKILKAKRNFGPRQPRRQNGKPYV